MHYYIILVDDLWHKLCNFLSVVDEFKVLGGKGEDIGYGEKQTTRISSLIFLSFVETLSMITNWRNNAYLLICEKFQIEK